MDARGRGFGGAKFQGNILKKQKKITKSCGRTLDPFLVCTTQNYLFSLMSRLIDVNSRTLKKFGGQWMGREDRHAFDGDKFICLDFIRHKNPSFMLSILQNSFDRKQYDLFVGSMMDLLTKIFL